MSLTTPVGVLGADSPAGEALCEALVEAGFARRAVIALDPDVPVPPEIAGLCWVGLGHGVTVESTLVLAPDLPVVAVAGAGDAAWPWVTAAGPDTEQRRLRLAPAAWTLMARLLAPLEAALDLRSVSASVLLPASEWGQAGLEALGQQTAAVLNFRDPPAGVLSERVAFNAVPTDYGEDHAAWCAGLLRDARTPVHVQTWAVPVFVGICGQLLIECGDPFSPAQLESLLTDALGADRARAAPRHLSPVSLTMAGEHLDWQWSRVGERTLQLRWVADNLVLGTARPAAALMRGLLGR